MRILLTTIMLSLALPLGAAEVPKKIPLTPEAFYVDRDGITVFGTITSKWKGQNDCNAALQLGMHKHPKFTTHSSNVGKVQFIPKNHNRRYPFRGYAFAEVTWGKSFAQLKQEADFKKEMESLERYKGILNRAKDDSHYQGLLAKLGTTEELLRNFLLLCCLGCEETLIHLDSRALSYMRNKELDNKLMGIGLKLEVNRMRGYPVKIEYLKKIAKLEGSSAEPYPAALLLQKINSSYPISLRDPLRLDGSGGCEYAWTWPVIGSKFIPSVEGMKSLEDIMLVDEVKPIGGTKKFFQFWWYSAKSLRKRERFEQLNFAPIFFEIANDYPNDEVRICQEALIITVHRSFEK